MTKDLWDQQGSLPPVDAAAAPTPAPVDTDRYRVLGLLGSGGMGRVLRAFDARLGREVARKELLDPALAARLRREARLTARLDHPGIVPVFDSGEDPGDRPWYTMRLVRGRTLAAHIAEGGDLRLVRPLLAAMQAVAHAHAVGVVHRDLKPENVLIGPFGEVQVADWGLARALDEAGPDEAVDGPGVDGGTRYGAVLGTVPWLSPEQARGEPADRRSDVWALGAMLRAVITGAPPLSVGTLDRIGRGERDRWPDGAGPAELRAIVERAMATDPADRYPDAAALALDVAAWLDGRPVAAHEYGPTELLVRFVRAWRVPLGLLAACAVTAGVIGGLAWDRTRAERDRAVAAEVRAGQEQARLRLELARLAEERGAVPEAEALIAGLPEDPDLVGLRLALTATPRPTRLRSAPLPPHRAAIPVPGGAVLLTEDALIGVEDDGATRWTTPGVASSGAWYAGRVALSGRGPDARGETLGWLDPGTGALSWTTARVEAATSWVTDPAGRLIALRQGLAQVIAGDASPGLWEPAACGVDAWTALVPMRDGLWWACRHGRAVLTDVGGRPLASSDVPFGPDAPDPSVVTGVAVDGDVIVGTARDVVARLDARGAAVRWRSTVPVGIVRALYVTPDARRLLVVGEDGGPALLDAQTGQLVLRLPAVDRGAVRVEDDRVVTFGARATTWTLPPADALPARLIHPVGVAALSAGDGLAAGLADGSVTVWRGAGPRVYAGGRSAVPKAVLWTPDALLVAWPADPPTRVPLDGGAPASLPLPVGARRAGLLGDGRLWALGYDGAFGVLGGTVTPGAVRGPTDAVSDGDGVLVLSQDGALTRLVPGGAAVALGVVAPDGTLARSADRLAVGSGPAVQQLARADRAPLAVTRFDGEVITALAWSDDGAHLAVGTRRGLVAVVDRAGAVVWRHAAHAERVVGLVWVADALWSASWDAWLVRHAAGPPGDWGLSAEEAARVVAAPRGR